MGNLKKRSFNLLIMFIVHRIRSETSVMWFGKHYRWFEKHRRRFPWVDLLVIEDHTKPQTQTLTNWAHFVQTKLTCTYWPKVGVEQILEYKRSWLMIKSYYFPMLKEDHTCFAHSAFDCCIWSRRLAQIFI